VAKFENLDEKISTAVQRARENREKEKAAQGEKPEERSMTTELKDLEAKITSAIGKVQELKKAKETSDKEIARLKGKLEEKDKEIEGLRTKLREELEGGLKEKDQAIDDLKTRLSSVDSQVESLLKEVLDK
jgi:predicted RNase H-like nuclease (RuvC/YqgF family)